MPRYYYLTPVLGGPGAPRFPVTGEVQIIGRSEEAHIPLLEATVSRRHASIQYARQTVHLSDLVSKHGTFVNSRRVTRADLRAGDIVVFGLSLVLRLEESGEPVAVPEPVEMGVAAPTLVDPIDKIRGSSPGPREARTTRQPTGMELELPRRRATDEDVVALCESMICDAYDRLSGLRAELRRTVDEGIDLIDPGDVLPTVESVTATLHQVSKALAVDGEVETTEARLREVVERVIDRLGGTYARRGIEFLSDVELAFRVRCDMPRLEEVLTVLLHRAGKASPDGQPVRLMATTAGGDRVRLLLSHRIREAGDELGAAGGGAGEPAEREMTQIKRMVLSLGGEISAETRPQVGTIVRLTLPLPHNAGRG